MRNSLASLVPRSYYSIKLYPYPSGPRAQRKHLRALAQEAAQGLILGAFVCLGTGDLTERLVVLVCFGLGRALGGHPTFHCPKPVELSINILYIVVFMCVFLFPSCYNKGGLYHGLACFSFSLGS